MAKKKTVSQGAKKEVRRLGAEVGKKAVKASKGKNSKQVEGLKFDKESISPAVPVMVERDKPGEVVKKQSGGIVVFSRFNEQRKQYEEVRKTKVTFVELESIAQSFEGKPVVENFNRVQLFNGEGEIIGTLYTAGVEML